MPKTILVTDKSDLFEVQKEASAADIAIGKLIEADIIAKRPKIDGTFTRGAENKLALHVETGIPVDFFATDEDRCWNALFVRTGPKSLNQEVARRALAMGWSWHGYGDGFTRTIARRTEPKQVKGERDVFAHVGLDYKEPWER